MLAYWQLPGVEEDKSRAHRRSWQGAAQEPVLVQVPVEPSEVGHETPAVML